jgi:glycosyltransferase involved in cell wall biosynthesis
MSAQDCDSAWELILADNGSTDGSMRIARNLGASLRLPIRVLDASQERCAAAARNVGIAHARFSKIVFCDADDLPLPGWLREMSAALQTATIAAGGVVHRHNDVPRSSCSYVQPFGYRPFYMSTNFGIWVQVLEEIGCFDERLRTSEDVDLCWRLAMSGHQVTPAPAARVLKRARTGRRLLHRYFQYGEDHVTLYRIHRAHGMPRRRLVDAAQSVGSTVMSAAQGMCSHAEAAQECAQLIGRVAGSMRQGVLYL